VSVVWSKKRWKQTGQRYEGWVRGGILKQSYPYGFGLSVFGCQIGAGILICVFFMLWRNEDMMVNSDNAFEVGIGGQI
jgi:hypothetical protein